MFRSIPVVVTFAGALIVVMVLGLFGIWRSERIDSANLKKELSSLRAQIVALKEEQSSEPALASLRQEVSALRALSSKVQSPQGVATAATSDAPIGRSAELRPMDPRARAEEQWFKNAQVANAAGDKLDAELARERVDTVWSSGTSTNIYAALKPLTSVHPVNVDCRTSLCRVVIQHESAEDQHGFAKKIIGSAPFDQDVLFRYDFESLPPKTTLYVARQGVSLPALAGDGPR